MKLLLVHPGASTSTHDVYVGHRDALRAAGHTCLEYLLDYRIDEAGAYLEFRHRRQKLPPPSPRQVISKACMDIPGMALYHGVDGVLIFSAMYLDPDLLIMLRRAGIRTAMLLTESPYDAEFEARLIGNVDVAFTNERTSLPYLRQSQPETHYLAHAHDPATHRPDPQPGDGDVPAHDVIFVGTLFQERIDLLAAVDWAGIDFAIYGSWELLGSRHRLRRHCREKHVPNARTAALYRRAKVNLNLYRTSKGFGRETARIDHAESLNPRALELAACGAFHLSGDRAEVREVFGDLVPTFGDSASLEAAIRHYLPHEEARNARARALPSAVSGHTYAARAAEMMATIAAAWSSRGRRIA